jgi:hypothetical protein
VTALETLQSARRERSRRDRGSFNKQIRNTLLLRFREPVEFFARNGIQFSKNDKNCLSAARFLPAAKMGGLSRRLWFAEASS